jgi:hypothetical protein
MVWQKRPRASALPDLGATSAECDRTDVPVVCADQGRGGGAAEHTHQALPGREPGRGGSDTDDDWVCGEPIDGRQGAVRGRYGSGVCGRACGRHLPCR